MTRSQASDLAGGAEQDVVAPNWVVVLYAAALGIVPFVVVALGLLLSQTGWFVSHSGSIFLANLDYGATLRNADCQIVIYGDSSALVGLDPALIRERTGMSACNIAEPANVTAVNGLAILDAYLARNRSPRVILLDFAPDNLPPNWKTSLTEGILVRVRSRPDLSTVALLAAHPEDTLRFATAALRLSVQGVSKAPLPAAAYTLRRLHAGYLPLAGKPMKTCRIYEHQREGRVQAPDERWIANLRTRYAAPGRLVLVYTTPLPICDPDLPFFAAQHLRLTDNQLAIYPVSNFNVTGPLHMTRAGAIRFSTEVGDRIATRVTSQLGSRAAAPSESR